MESIKPLRLVVAINPTASFGRGKNVGPRAVEALRALGHDVTALEQPNFALLLKRGRKAVAKKPDALLVVGGDGMVNLGTNLVAKTKVPLGIIPSGTGNDMARGLGIPLSDVDAAVASVVRGLARPPRAIDAGSVTYVDDATGSAATRWFACVLSAGFDAIVNERANLMSWPRGASRYTVALLIELLRLRPIHYKLTLDDVVIETTAALVSVGNNVSLGGGMKVTPDAILDDGLADVLVVEALSRLAFLRVFPRVFSGKHLSDPRVTVYRAKRIRIESEDIMAYADGERFAALPIDIKMVAGVLNVLDQRP
ncbi:diacylglycerol kinase [Salinibacterium sp. NSLL150]|uniref:diacylglycerol kinase family protein n=1 Tax=unclassified Salinibacterium TaxID=2632331 RepID=UPI0018CE0564|nr:MULTISPECIES: diacylglycerol kinase family protein [unclassified Salinibacterium]MBH0098612.1 diacylglycerol kinase [Salinibacterium sp. NSLL35]MBH0101367.1 diacylglycerol kinase [Salinibacterium sp. NSLL150]MBH0104126.1 diacylglycerol kinase [Salinibacterium sp. NSLL16]MBH0106887.1 diacylglycerol kinase [Salinibacterium sp. NSLL17]